MYIAIYNEDLQHITNIDNVTYSLTQRVYDPDTFTADGISAIDINNAKIAIVNDDEGNYIYACFADNITPEKDKRTVKGLDFKTLFDTEILIDYTSEGSFDGRLSSIFRKVVDLVFNSPDLTVKKVNVDVVIPDDFTDTTELFGSLQGQYEIKNAYTFLKGYLKYYEYNIATQFNVVTNKIIFTFIKNNQTVAINLNDFIYELTTTSTTTNKAVATIKFDTSTGEPRPSTIATRYYYINKNNDIVQADEHGQIAGRIYPVKTKIFESEYLADAQFNAVYELANSRYVDNIIIDNNIIIDPIDLSIYPLYTKVQLYYDGKLYKTLPIYEKITTLDGSGQDTKIKLGAKKILLTEIIKG